MLCLHVPKGSVVSKHVCCCLQYQVPDRCMCVAGWQLSQNTKDTGRGNKRKVERVPADGRA